MQEILYNIEINRGGQAFQGKLYSDIDGMKEFQNHRLDKLLRDMIFDMQLNYDEFSNRILEAEEIIEEVHY